MIRFLVRLIAFFTLAAATVLAIGDTARSIAASAWRPLSMEQAATLAAPYIPWSMPELGSAAGDMAEWLWSVVALWPASITIAVPALLLFGLTARR
ncbi:hypothetical protein FPY71_02595 [Aureimonas fodinaquatilis]|uniref:PetM family of cytochrome b6f complex subunit 7 n=1 Tax=Aureimonas fodinaquatilis TaxID=2565783 RepID=A0A5B0E1M7_9HYPH|nr:hypothetical protein [Aureimonas fodinaquatilis]KAA0972025.1 hypothetical protein FPY71_02595 [Aureimonas fodinaquatilis]